jgi:hypothetical protein
MHHYTQTLWPQLKPCSTGVRFCRRSAWRAVGLFVWFVGVATVIHAQAITQTLTANKTVIRPGEAVTYTATVGGYVYFTILSGYVPGVGSRALRSNGLTVVYPSDSDDPTYFIGGYYSTGTFLCTTTFGLSPSAPFAPGPTLGFSLRSRNYVNYQNTYGPGVMVSIGAVKISEDGDTSTWQNVTTAVYLVTKTTDYWVSTQEDEEGNSETLYSGTFTSSATLLPNGTYTISNWYDRPMADGNRESQIESVTLTMDTLAPTEPTNLATSGHTTNAFTLSWTASTDNFGVADYEVFKNGVSVGTTSGTSLAVSGLNLTTLYNMTVRARDVTGNLSPLSGTKAVWVDVTKPSAPGTPQLSAPYHLSWPPSTDNGGVTGYEVSFNGAVLALTTDNFLDHAALLGASGPVTVKARDIASNWSDPSPTLTISSQSATTSMGFAAANSGPMHVTLAWKAPNDGLTVASYNIYRDGASPVFRGQTTELGFVDTGLPSSGNVTYRIRTVNAAGVESSSEATVTLSVPATFPGDTDSDGIPDAVETALGITLSTTVTRDSANALLVKLHRPN